MSLFKETLTFKGLLKTFTDDFFNSYREMFESLSWDLSDLRFIHDEDKRRIEVYDSSIDKITTVMETPLLTLIYSFNEPKILIDNIPGCGLIRIIPDYKCLYQVIVLAMSYRDNVKAVTKFFEL